MWLLCYVFCFVQSVCLGWAADDFGENRGLHGLLFSPVIMPVSSTLLRLGNESVQKVPTWWSKKRNI
jgi:hypothetical protein